MIESVWEYPARRRGFPVFLRFFPVNRGLSGNFDGEGFAQDCVLRHFRCQEHSQSQQLNAD